MGRLQVLGDANVRDILISLSHNEVLSVLDQVSQSLKAYSTPQERDIACNSIVVHRPHAKTLFRPFTSPDNVGVKIIVNPSAGAAAQSGNSNKDATLHGMLALCDKNGVPVGIMNADEITGYRTSMSVMVPYMWRARTARIVVFGAGKQALWHVRLALSLRGKEIEQIAIINRSAERLCSLVDRLRNDNDIYWRSPAHIVGFSSTSPDHEAHLKALLADADVVFCTTPSRQPLFDAKYLEAHQSNSTGCYVSSVGSWQSNMIEIDPKLLRDTVIRRGEEDAQGAKNGVVIVDDREECLRSSGEVIRSQLQEKDLVEVGEILASKADGSVDSVVAESLATGFIVYKSIGVSSTDLAAASAVLELAQQRSIGVAVDDF